MVRLLRREVARVQPGEGIQPSRTLCPSKCRLQRRFGSFETGSTTDSETELEVSYLNLYLDGKSVMEIDKFNYVCKIGDEDMLETVRKDLGLA